MRKIPTPMTNRRILAGLLVAVALAACSKRDTPPASPNPTAEQRDADAGDPKGPAGAAAVDACKLLSNEEIAAVQGEAPARAQLVGESAGPLSVSQCNFLLPTGSNSLSIRVVERGKGPEARDAREVWRETFHTPPGESADKRHARQYEKVEGVGEEAFWLGNRKSGGLHVLSGDRYIRVSVGGQEEVPAKIEKTAKLARHVLPRLEAAK